MSNDKHHQRVLRLGRIKELCAEHCPCDPNILMGILQEHTENGELTCKYDINFLIATKQLIKEKIIDKKTGKEVMVLKWAGKKLI